MKKSVKKAGGGQAVYEHQMMGEKKGSKGAHANYESTMRGEHATHKPAVKMSSYAKGGVGKIRHEQATMSGKPKAPKALGKIARG
ncbi:MAG TPA: hypothetical protein VGF75_01205 [Candidatus Saccharimonadales bacterium]|jgi:hypothetical protein